MLEEWLLRLAEELRCVLGCFIDPETDWIRKSTVLETPWRHRVTQKSGALILFLLAFSPALAAAQEGATSGRVADETGAVLPGATVTLSGPEGTRVTQADGNGDYEFAGLSGARIP